MTVKADSRTLYFVLNHWTLFYYFATFVIGVFSTGLATVIFVKTRTPLVRTYLLWYLSFSFVTVTDILFAYIETNLSVRDQIGLVLLFFLNLIMIYLFMFTLPMFSHELYDLTSRKQRNIVVGVIVFGEYIGLHGLTWLSTPSWQPELISFLCLDLPLVVISVYVLLLSIQHYRQFRDTRQKAMAGKLLGVFGGLTFIVLEDSVIGWLPSILLYPVAYAGIGVFFSWYFLEIIWLHPPLQGSSLRLPTPSIPDLPGNDFPLVPKPDAGAATEMVCDQYQLSSREKEVLDLLLQGQTNVQIAENLFISPNTVKTHIKNIYEKVGVKRRYELIARFQRTPPSDTLPNAS